MGSAKGKAGERNARAAKKRTARDAKALRNLVESGGDANYASTGVLSAIVGALLPLIVSFIKRPAVAA